MHHFALQLQADISADVQAISQRYFPLVKRKDVAFELGRVCMATKHFDHAVDFLLQSNADCGEHFVTFFNLGMCFWYLEEVAVARAAILRSLELNPEYDSAHEWLKRIELKLNGTPTSNAASAQQRSADGDIEGGDGSDTTLEGLLADWHRRRAAEVDSADVE